MKKLLCACLCVAVMLSLLPAFAEGVSEVMQVVKCNEYVSLRESPDTTSKRLVKVHLGELVSNCEAAENGFIKCSWENKTGYILEKYLQTTPYTLSDGILPNQMVVKCEEYVSLRESPDTSSKRLIKVPLGAVVTGCVSYMGNFVLCEYKGHKGYVLSKYLAKADYSKPAPTPKPTATPEPKVYSSLPYYMEVINCNEWVTLRNAPSSSAASLAKVPLGAVVEACEQVNDLYAGCTYQGQAGFIAIKYLGAYEPKSESAFDDLDFPSYQLFKTRGSEVIDKYVDGFTVAARRNYGENYEEIMAVCYGKDMLALWTVGGKTGYMTELTLTDAIIAGDENDPLLIIYLVDSGMTAYGIGQWTDELWKLGAEETQALGGSLSYAVSKEGDLYITGYYSGTLMKISKDGQIIWKTEQENSDIYWPYLITLTDTGVLVYYDSCMTGGYDDVYEVEYSFDGEYVKTQIVPDPQKTGE